MSLTFGGVNRPNMTAVAGTTRWNTTNNSMEVFDGATWQLISSDEIQNLTMKEMVEQFEDEIAVMVDGEYADNATIQDAFKAWEEANERFRLVLAIAEKK